MSTSSKFDELGSWQTLSSDWPKFDQNGVPTRSNVILDLTTKSYVDFDAWCVSADVYIQSFTNGLCLNVEHGNLIAKAHCEMKWTIFPADYKKNQWVEFRTEINGKTLALTAHTADDGVSLEEIITDNTNAKMPLQKWNVHYP